MDIKQTSNDCEIEEVADKNITESVVKIDENKGSINENNFYVPNICKDDFENNAAEDDRGVSNLIPQTHHNNNTATKLNGAEDEEERLGNENKAFTDSSDNVDDQNDTLPTLTKENSDKNYLSPDQANGLSALTNTSSVKSAPHVVVRQDPGNGNECEDLPTYLPQQNRSRRQAEIGSEDLITNDVREKFNHFKNLNVWYIKKNMFG